jgi:hypothetical protein
MESAAGHPWVREADGAAVDLHSTLFGIGAGPGAVWDAFAADAVRQAVGGAEVALPSYPARLLHVCLHAVQHGGEPGSKSMLDLERALELVPADPDWRRALELAERLEAGDAFATGLRLTAAGRELAMAIGARAGSSARARLRVDWVPMAEGFQELSEARGLRAKLALLARELAPNPAFMRWWTPLSRRGRLGLVASYPWRWLWLASRALPGFLAWRRASGGRPRRR